MARIQEGEKTRISDNQLGEPEMRAEAVWPRGGANKGERAQDMAQVGFGQCVSEVAVEHKSWPWRALVGASRRERASCEL